MANFAPPPERIFWFAGRQICVNPIKGTTSSIMQNTEARHLNNRKIFDIGRIINYSYIYFKKIIEQIPENLTKKNLRKFDRNVCQTIAEIVAPKNKLFRWCT